MKAAEVITTTAGGRTFHAGRRTAAHVQDTHEAFEKAFPDLRLLVAQPCYNVGVPASAGTHDRDGVLDWWITKATGALATADDYWRVQRWMRSRGWAIWFRHTGSWAARRSWHLHGVSLGCPGPLGIFVAGQVDDFYRHTFGLKGQHNTDLDKSWFPGDVGPHPAVGTPAQWRAAINKTVFDYPAWLAEENDMKPDEIATAPITMLSGPDNKPKKTTLEKVLRDLEGTQDTHGAQLNRIESMLKKLTGGTR